MKDKTVTLDRALDGVTDGMTVMVGGFGLPGTPLTLLQALLDTGAKDLTLIKNEANEAGMGVSLLIEAGRVSKMVLSHLGLNVRAVEMRNQGELEVEFHPQGILAEKIRAGGAGLPGLLSDIGIDTIIREGKQIVTVNGREAMVEPSLRADVALVHAARADRVGNLRYTRSANNFNPLMAMAADLVVAEAVEVVETGDMDPDDVHTPGCFVDRLVDLGGLPDAYKVMEHHVAKA